MGCAKAAGFGFVTAVLAALGWSPAAQGACGKITIAEMTWASAAVAAHVDHFVLSRGYGCRSELVPGDTVPTATSMAEKGEPDIAPEIWFNSARTVLERALAEDRLRVATEILSDGGVEGWYVPRYMVDAHPELTTLQAVMKRPDLFPDKEEPGKGRFYTCPAGWACQIINRNLFKAYGLDKAGFTMFNPGSGEGLAAAIDRANSRKLPILTYYWSPTALLGRYPMVKLGGMKHDPATWDCVVDKDCADPKPNLWPKSVVYTVVTSSFAESAPEAFKFVSSMSWSNGTLEKILAWKEERRANNREAALHFLRNHEDVWSRWVPADVQARIKAAL